MNSFNSLDVQHFDVQNSKKERKKEKKCSLQLFGTRAKLQNILKN